MTDRGYEILTNEVREIKAMSHIGVAMKEGQKYHYMICHACEEGLLNDRYDKILLEFVAHNQSQKHRILMDDYL